MNFGSSSWLPTLSWQCRRILLALPLIWTNESEAELALQSNYIYIYVRQQDHRFGQLPLGIPSRQSARYLKECQWLKADTVKTVKERLKAIRGDSATRCLYCQYWSFGRLQTSPTRRWFQRSFSEELLIYAQSSSSYETVFVKINHILDDTGSEYLELYEDDDCTLPVWNRLRSRPFGINEPINRWREFMIHWKFLVRDDESLVVSWI